MKLKPLLLAALWLASGTLQAAGDGTAATLSSEAAAVDSYAVGHSSTVESRISASFGDLSSFPGNASALVSGLRQGTPVNLLSTAPDGTATITSFTPATGPMGYGNVRISLALAQQQLAGLGIANPTPEQLAAALNGGQITYVAPDGVVTTTQLRGTLEMRAAGMGWGQIAQAQGTKLGPVISGLKVTHAPGSGVPGGSSVTAGTTAAATQQGGPKGVSTGAGKASAAGSNPGGGHAYGKGIVTAYGTGAGGVVDTNPGKGHAYGQSAKAASTISTASGAGAANAQGGGNAYGHGKAAGKN
jgi:hypothetical protein